MLVGLHKASFIVWFVRLRNPRPRLPAPAATPRTTRRGATGGAALRAGAIGASLVAGIALASVTFPLARPWAAPLPTTTGSGPSARPRHPPSRYRQPREQPSQSHPLACVELPGSPASRATRVAACWARPGAGLRADRRPERRTGSWSSRPANASSGSSRAPGTSARVSPSTIPTTRSSRPAIVGSRSTRNSTTRSRMIDLRTHRLVWSYGHAGVAGSAGG